MSGTAGLYATVGKETGVDGIVFTGRKHKISADQSDAGRPETGTERADRKSHGTVPTERTFCKKNVSGTPCVIHRWRQKNERSQKYIGRI